MPIAASAFPTASEAARPRPSACSPRWRAMLTPEFLAWAIEQTCPLRGELDGSDPERIERQLRALREVSTARREGRVLDGICLQPPEGFRLADALALFGGEAAARQACGNCPANALAKQDREADREQLAGCYGLVPLPLEAAAFHEAVERASGAVYAPAEWSLHYPLTRPRWYGLWIASPLEGAALLERFLVLQAAAESHPQLRELLTALNAAYDAGCRLHVRLYPPGHVEGSWWRLAAYCPRCQAQWTRSAARQC